MRVELRAIAEAMKYFEREGYTVFRVSGKKGHGGYDLLVKRPEKQLKVEVKGCSREWGIPDLYSSEFDSEHRLIADVLCVVYCLEDKPRSICLIPREAIPVEFVKPKSGFRISSKFKKRSVLERYLHQIRE